MAKCRGDRERVANQCMDLVIATIGEKNQALLWIRGERDVPRCSADLSVELRVDQRVLDERAVFSEHLDALVATITDVQQAVVATGDAVRRIELLAWWTAAIERRQRT